MTRQSKKKKLVNKPIKFMFRCEESLALAIKGFAKAHTVDISQAIRSLVVEGLFLYRGKK